MFIIRNVRKVEDALAAARRLLDSLNTPIPYGSQDLLVTGSVGIVIPGLGADAETVLRDADTAMYQAKAAGRNRFELFDEELHHRSVSRLEREGDLRAALEHGEFDLHYQPIVDPRDGTPVGAEALLRWLHPVHGLVPPLEFIPVAEESGLIRPIGSWVFDHAVEQMARWDADPHGPRLQLLCVNFSARQLDDVEAVDRIGATLAREHVAPSRVHIEITESVAMADRQTTRASLEAFKDLGLGSRSMTSGLGTRRSPTSTPSRCRPSRSTGPSSSGWTRLTALDPVVSAILDLSHAMGLRVVAEGVSTPALSTLVAVDGLRARAGLLLGEPLPADAVRGMVAAIGALGLEHQRRAPVGTPGRAVRLGRVPLPHADPLGRALAGHAEERVPVVDRATQVAEQLEADVPEELHPREDPDATTSGGSPMSGSTDAERAWSTPGGRAPATGTILPASQASRSIRARASGTRLAGRMVSGGAT